MRWRALPTPPVPEDVPQLVQGPRPEPWPFGREGKPVYQTDWRSDDQPINDVDDRGWWLQYLIPFESLGLDGPPPQGTVWGLAVAVHDRDDAENTPIDDTLWPENMLPEVPATWGQLAFGLPVYSPPPAAPKGTTTVRHGLAGATVVDADVGGSSVCGQMRMKRRTSR